MSSKPFDPRSRSTVSGLSLASAPVSPWRFRVLVALGAMVVGSLVTWVLVPLKGGDTEPAALAEPPAVAPSPATSAAVFRRRAGRGGGPLPLNLCLRWPRR